MNKGMVNNSRNPYSVVLHRIKKNKVNPYVLYGMFSKSELWDAIYCMNVQDERV